MCEPLIQMAWVNPQIWLHDFIQGTETTCIDLYAAAAAAIQTG